MNKRASSNERQSSGEVGDLELEPDGSERVLGGASTPTKPAAEPQKASMTYKTATMSDKQGSV